MILLNTYLKALREASPENHPWSREAATDTRAQEMGEAFARMVNGMADFVDAVRKAPGHTYDEARMVLEDVVHTFPMLADPYIPDTLEGLDLEAPAPAADDSPDVQVRVIDFNDLSPEQQEIVRRLMGRATGNESE